MSLNNWLQRWSEQFPLLLRATGGGQTEAGRTIAGPRSVLRSNPQRRSAGSYPDRVGHFHIAVRTQAGPASLRCLPRWPPRRIHTGNSFNLKMSYKSVDRFVFCFFSLTRLQARPLKTKELTDPEISSIIGEKMAQIHTLDVPISKEPTWLWDTLGKWMNNLNQVVKTGNSISFDSILMPLHYFAVTESIGSFEQILKRNPEDP